LSAVQTPGRQSEWCCQYGHENGSRFCMRISTHHPHSDLILGQVSARKQGTGTGVAVRCRVGQRREAACDREAGFDNWGAPSERAAIVRVYTQVEAKGGPEGGALQVTRKKGEESGELKTEGPVVPAGYLPSLTVHSRAWLPLSPPLAWPRSIFSGSGRVRPST
jgi:hypothetical protein